MHIHSNVQAEQQMKLSEESADPLKVAKSLDTCVSALGVVTNENQLSQYIIYVLCIISNSTSGKGVGHEAWKTMLDLVKNLSEVILSTLPNFWRIAKNYMEGKYKKVYYSLFASHQLTCPLAWCTSLQQKSITMQNNGA